MSIKKIVLFILPLFLVLSCGDDPEIPPFIEPDNDGTAFTDMRDISAMQLVADMKSGINLGNTLDTESEDETFWGNSLTTKPMIDALAERGFKTLRLPVTWGYHMGAAPDYLIEQAWMDRVEEIANYAFSNDMYVIINIHHDDDWIIPTYAKEAEVANRLSKVWTQIANRFESYGDYLVFETLNEPREKGTPHEWNGGSAENRDVINTFHKSCVDAIRATGGNNAERFIMVSTCAASSAPDAINDLIIPNNDEKIIVSVHSYFPFPFALGGTDPDWGTDTDKQELDAELDKIYNKFVANGRAVIMSEWISGDKNSVAADRLTHATYYSEGCASRQIAPLVWDVGNSSDDAGVMDRRNLTWFLPEIADAIINATK